MNHSTNPDDIRILNDAIVGIRNSLISDHEYWEDPVEHIVSITESEDDREAEERVMREFSPAYESLRDAVDRTRDALSMLRGDDDVRRRLRELHADLLLILVSFSMALSGPFEILEDEEYWFGEAYRAAVSRSISAAYFFEALADELDDAEYGRTLDPSTWKVRPPEKYSEPELAKRVRRAGASYEWVCASKPDLASALGTPARVTRKQYEYLKEQGHTAYADEDGCTYSIPAYDTWARYVREYLLITHGPKNQPRRGRKSGGSVVDHKDL